MKLLWLDLETTGLDPAKNVILEVAVSVADLATPFVATPIYHAVLVHHGQGLDPFIVDMHTKNGLLAECLESSLVPFDADEALCQLIPEAATHA